MTDKPDFAAMADAIWGQCAATIKDRSFSESTAKQTISASLSTAYAQGRADERERCAGIALAEKFTDVQLSAAALNGEDHLAFRRGCNAQSEAIAEAIRQGDDE